MNAFFTGLRHELGRRLQQLAESPSMVWAFRQGYRDGRDQPVEMTIGMTYQSEHVQWAWDQGANFGQWLGRRK